MTTTMPVIVSSCQGLPESISPRKHFIREHKSPAFPAITSLSVKGWGSVVNSGGFLRSQEIWWRKSMCGTDAMLLAKHLWKSSFMFQIPWKIRFESY